MVDKRKDNIIVEDFEDKKYGEGKKAGRYTRFQTDQGWISSFHKPTIEKLKDSVGEEVRVEIETDKNDKDKIIKFLGDATDDGEVSEDDEPVKTERPGQAARKSVKGSAYEKDPVGLAIEMFVAIIAGMEDPSNPKTMDEAINLAINFVKQAKESFE